METRLLQPDQIITLNDYPVYNEQILRIYFRIYRQGVGWIMPPAPVIEKERVAPFIQNPLLSDFLRQYPDVGYSLLDGSHKTTAATLAHQPIQAMIFKIDRDIEQAKMMAQEGDLFSLTTGDTIGECVEVLQEHFRAPAEFQTVLEKTRRMAEESAIPSYMVISFQNPRNS